MKCTNQFVFHNMLNNCVGLLDICAKSLKTYYKLVVLSLIFSENSYIWLHTSSVWNV